MRYPNIFGQVKAAPEAKAAPDIALDDSNSFIDPTQPDRRIPNELKRRHFAVAESSLPEGFEELDPPADGG